MTEEQPHAAPADGPSLKPLIVPFALWLGATCATLALWCAL